MDALFVDRNYKPLRNSPAGRNSNVCRLVLAGLTTCGVAVLGCALQPAVAQTPAITIDRSVPGELNPSNGGAPKATPDQAAAFAWQEFIALNWPAGPQQGAPGQRDTPSTGKFGDPTYVGPLVWETLRAKVEIFPGNGSPPHGYPGSNATNSWGYDDPPAYIYSGGPIAACDKDQSGDKAPWINLDETDQITLASMYAGVVLPESSRGNSSPQLIRFLAKANRSQYVYVAGNSSATRAASSMSTHSYGIPLRLRKSRML